MPDSIEAALTVAHRLKDPGQGESAAALAATQSEFPLLAHWSPPSIAQGNAGLAVLWAYLDACFPGEGWDATGKVHLELAVRSAERQAPAGPGLFSGIGGLAFAAAQLSRGGTRYRGLLASLDGAITAQVMPMAARLHAASGVCTGDFDVISGLSGVGAYLLCRHREPSAQVALANITNALVSLVTRKESPPPWYTPPAMLYDDAARRTYPNGNLNCGLAHGLPGVLAFLALARNLEIGLTHKDMLDLAISTAANWLCAHRVDDQWGVNWPTAVPLSVDECEPPSRSAWCYGAPGVARSLWLAGGEYRELAVAAMEAVYRRPLPARAIDSPTFCHGIAGLLATTLRFARDTNAPVFIEESRKLTTQLIESFQPDSLLGFRSMEYRNNETDQPGLLDGAAGVALVLLAQATGVEPSWDRLFLLS
jgi:lantibiotic biosynthesis protein